MNARLIRRFAVVITALTVAGCALQPPETDALNAPDAATDVLSTSHAKLAAVASAPQTKLTLRQKLAALANPSAASRACMQLTHQDRAACNSPESVATMSEMLAAAGASQDDAAVDDQTSDGQSVASGARDVSDFHQIGSASWYGNRFHGRRTASGERYDMNEMTAAHRYLPLFSYIRVTNALNHRSVIVKVNDRGPFHSHRILDLSYAAAQALGMGKRGTEKVSITGLSPQQARAEMAAPLLASR